MLCQPLPEARAPCRSEGAVVAEVRAPRLADGRHLAEGEGAVPPDAAPLRRAAASSATPTAWDRRRRRRPDLQRLEGIETAGLSSGLQGPPSDPGAHGRQPRGTESTRVHTKDGGREPRSPRVQ